MKVLSEINLNLNTEDIEITYFNSKEIKKYNHFECEMIVCSRATAREVVNLDFPKLKFIQLTSAGFDNVPIKEFKEREIKVSNLANIYGVAISETIVFTMLMFAKKFRKNPNRRCFRLRRGYDQYITELEEKTVLILGVGNIGKETAKRLKAFGMKTVGYATYTRDVENFDLVISSIKDLYSELNKADYVVSTLPDNKNTEKFISTNFLNEMKKTAYFINVGRRNTIDEKVLYQYLKQNHINGAALDMFEILPNYITNPFKRLSNVIVLPGVAAISKEVTQKRKVYIENRILELYKTGTIYGTIKGD